MKMFGGFKPPRENEEADMESRQAGCHLPPPLASYMALGETFNGSVSVFSCVDWGKKNYLLHKVVVRIKSDHFYLKPSS